MQPKKENINPLCNTQRQPSCIPPVRNPFKVVSQKEKDHEPNKLPTIKGGEKRDDQGREADLPEAHEGESHQTPIVRKEALVVAKESKSIVMPSDMYRGKQLPAGMKVKKRLSAEESAKENKVEQVKAKSGESDNSGKEDKSNPTSNIEPVHPEKTSSVYQDLHKDKNLKPEQPLKSSLSKSSTKSGSQSSNQDSENTQEQMSECPTLSTKTSRKDQQEEDDDEVVLVSVKPATTRSPPVSAVQKALTAFPGFQPASKVKSQQGDPRGLHNLLSAQLKQKKVSFWSGGLPFI